VIWLEGAMTSSLLRVPFSEKFDLLAKFRYIFGKSCHFCVFIDILRGLLNRREVAVINDSAAWARRSAFVCSCFLVEIKVQRRRVLPSTIQFLS